MKVCVGDLLKYEGPPRVNTDVDDDDAAFLVSFENPPYTLYSKATDSSIKLVPGDILLILEMERAPDGYFNITWLFNGLLIEDSPWPEDIRKYFSMFQQGS